jgi:AraC family carnitine catabolism transcriptional activator
MTLHWEARAAFQDLFPKVEVLDQIFVVDKDRWTCAGGTAALDMMLYLISMDNGPELAQVVTDGFVHGQPRAALTPQRQSKGAVHSDLWSRVHHLMQATCTEPIDMDTLCSRIGTSRRTLERLAAQTVGMSPSEYYLRLRLMAGKEMLMYSNKAVSRIAEALGFSSPSDFSRAFKRAFDVSPFAFRVASKPEFRHLLRPQEAAAFIIH